MYITYIMKYNKQQTYNKSYIQPGGSLRRGERRRPSHELTEQITT